MTPSEFFHYFFYVRDIPAQFAWVDGLRILVRVIMGVFGVLLTVPPLIWLERRLLGWMQQRQGPNRVGPFGLFQPLADAVKLLFKEDMNPANVDTFLFVIAPALFLIPALTTAGVIPWGPSRTWGAPAPNVNIGILYILAWASLGVYGVVLAGWSSNNKYSLLGGLRSSAQLISYELGMGMAIITIVLITGSLGMQDIADHQGPRIWTWNIAAFFPMGFLAMIIYSISMLAETNRAPFDLPEAETELVAGYHTEYTSMKFATFFLAEYANMVVVCGINTTLFWGGYHAPIPYLDQLPNFMVNLYAPDPTTHAATLAHWNVPWLTDFVNMFVIPFFWFGIKVFCGLYFFIWMRATMPRLRYDQLMKFGWQGLLPVALVNILCVAIAITFGWLPAAIIWVLAATGGIVAYASSKQGKLFANNTRRNTSVVLHGSAQPFRNVAEHSGHGVQTLPSDAPAEVVGAGRP